MKKTLSSCFEETLLASVVSVRGPLLTLRKKSTLWVLRAGHDPRAWTLKLDAQGEGRGDWKQARPDFDALLHTPEHFLALREKLRRQLGAFIERHIHPRVHATPEDMSGRRECLRKLLKLDRLMRWARGFPPEAMRFLESHRFQSRRWHLLNLWLRVPGGRELFDDVPALAWLAASSWCFKTHPVQRPLRSLRALVKKPRRHLLRWLDLPEGGGTIHLLRTVRAADMNPLLAEAVCRVLRDEPRRRWWQNLPLPARAEAVQLLGYQWPLSFPLLRAISEGRCIGGPHGGMKVAQVFHDTLRMLRVLDRTDEREALARLESPERLLEAHDRLAADFAVARAARGRAGRPAPPGALTGTIPPPLPPAPWMQPVTSLDELLREGAEMRHCVAGYEYQIAARRYYVYAIRHPLGRATLGLHRVGCRSWAVAELRGRRNADAPPAVRAAVSDWLGSVCPDADARDHPDGFDDFDDEAGDAPDTPLWLEAGADHEAVEEEDWMPF